MKNLWYTLILFMTGCAPAVTTSPTSGKLKLCGIPIPFTGGKEPVVIDSKLAILVEQLEKFTWVGIVLVIAGAVWWKITEDFTGLGKTLFGVGWIFIGLALGLPQVIAYLVLITVITIVLALGYVAVVQFKKRKQNLER